MRPRYFVSYLSKYQSLRRRGFGFHSRHGSFVAFHCFGHDHTNINFMNFKAIKGFFQGRCCINDKEF